MKSVVWALCLLLPQLAWSEPLHLTVSIMPQKYFVEKITGNTVSVNVMVPPGADPHTYEPKPRQMMELQQSKLYFSIGIEFENIWLPRFKDINTNMQIIPTDQGIPKLGGQIESFEEESDHQHEWLDPHIWLSPLLVKIQIVHMLQALIRLNPEQTELYQQNYQRFQAELDQLHFELQQRFQTAESKTFLVFHPVWGYFAQAYGLTQVPIQIGGKEPKPGQLKMMILAARKQGIHTLFLQPQISSRTADLVSRETGASLIVLDPLAYDWPATLKTATQHICSPHN
ncbi:MAG: zinc ABC transporter substrate-binding protein [SAR324 cluster bacterium]|nr:zinc ABC transporter substrate-binding protein [SAR324 cluster bacterium]